MKTIKTHQPCPCGRSSDAYTIYEDGGHCFSCDKSIKEEIPITDDTTFQYVPWRGIAAATMEKYNASTKVQGETPVEIAFNYGEFDGVKAQKIRNIQNKMFVAKGPMKETSLFAKDVFPPGSSDCVVVTEGELDAMSVYQMIGKPAVSVRGASSAGADCGRKENRDYLNSFPRIYLAFDSDEPGKAATDKVAKLFDNQKVYHVKLGALKDANSFLQEGKADEFKNVWFYSKRFLPEGVVSSFTEIEAILNAERQKEIITYPFKRLQEITYGIRTRECVLITAQEGQGKTEIVRAIEAHTLRTTDYNIGIIHLEEGKQRSIQGLAGYEIGQPVHLPGSGVSVSDVIKGYKGLVRRDERVHIVNYFDDDDPAAALELIRFLATTCDCKIIFLDHITMLVTGNEDEDERRRLDILSTKLAKMVEELDFALVFISHVNDEGKTRGSRNISKVAHIRIDINRDHLAVDPVERNKTYLTVSKNRFGSTTGPAGVLTFNPETFIVKEFDENEEFVPG